MKREVSQVEILSYQNLAVVNRFKKDFPGKADRAEQVEIEVAV